MRQVITLLFASVFMLSSCQRRPSSSDVQMVGTADFVSNLPMNDPHTAWQLLYGFYNLGDAPWRWTGNRFGVLLRVPPGASERGGVLRLHFTLPDVILNPLGPVTLRATANLLPLPPHTYDAENEYVYQQEIPSERLRDQLVRIDFDADKVLAPRPNDPRALSVIVSEVELAAK